MVHKKKLVGNVSLTHGAGKAPKKPPEPRGWEKVGTMYDKEGPLSIEELNEILEKDGPEEGKVKAGPVKDKVPVAKKSKTQTKSLVRERARFSSGGKTEFDLLDVIKANIQGMDKFAQYYLLRDYSKGKAPNPRVYEDVTFDEWGAPNLERADLSLWVPDATCLVFGRRRTGKSTFIRDLLVQMGGWFPRGVVVSKTERNNKVYSKHFPKGAIMHRIDDDALDALLVEQTELLNHEAKDQLEKEDPNYYRLLCIFDDIVTDAYDIRYSEPLNQMFTQGRHFKVFGAWATQYFKAFSPSMRTNLDYGVVFTVDDEDSRDNIRKLFANTLDKYMFYRLLDKYTDDHMCLIVDNSNPQEKRLLHKFKFYKARLPEEIGEFYLGNDYFWKNWDGDGPNPGLKVLKT